MCLSILLFILLCILIDSNLFIEQNIKHNNNVISNYEQSYEQDRESKN